MSYRMTISPVLSKIAGLGAFLSLGLFVAGLFISEFNEDFGEFLILCSPTLPLFPMVLAFHQLYHQRFPYRSHAVRVIGIIGAASVLIGYILGFLNPANSSPYISGFVLCTIGCIGLWLILNGLLGLQTKAVPRLLAMLSIIVGVAWIIGIGSTVIGLFNSLLVQSFVGFLGINILALVISYLLWTVWTGYWFLTSRVNNLSV
ncbi:MAG: hypothetical protein AAFQ91_15730 [Cyanobacteria bacterium J06621_15]